MDWLDDIDAVANYARAAEFPTDYHTLTEGTVFAYGVGKRRALLQDAQYALWI